MPPVAASTWQGAPAPLEGDGVHLWRVGLDRGPRGVAALPDEEQRARRMRDGTRRARFLASRAWLRVVVGRYVGEDAAAVRFTVADGGKPAVVDGGGLCFSFSRSADLALVALARGRPVGVDVERVRPDVDHRSVAEHFFAPAEADALRMLSEPDRRDAFFTLWVRKEAVVKASGAGLGDGVGHLDVREDRVAGRWSVATIDVGAPFRAAVAVDGRMGPITMGALPTAGEPSAGLRGVAPGGRGPR